MITDKLEETIKKFISNKKEQELVFKSANPFERKILHELAEKYNLDHESEVIQ